MRPVITEILLRHLDASLENPPLACEEYFNLLTQLLTVTGDSSPNEEPPKDLKLTATNAMFGNLAAE